MRPTRRRSLTARSIWSDCPWATATILYAEPLVGLALPGDFSDVFTGLCSSSVSPACMPPPVNTNFNVRVLPASP